MSMSKTSQETAVAYKAVMEEDGEGWETEGTKDTIHLLHAVSDQLTNAEGI